MSSTKVSPLTVAGSSALAAIHPAVAASSLSTAVRPTCGGARATEPPMQVFHHDDAGYRAWVGAHPEGYVLNVPHGYRRSHPARLHQASCRVIAKADPSVRQTRDARKVCATDRAALLEWAKQHGYTLLPCSFCDSS